MPIIIFDVTEDDYVLFFEPENFRFFHQKVEPHIAYFYQLKLDEEIFIHQSHKFIIAS